MLVHLNCYSRREHGIMPETRLCLFLRDLKGNQNKPAVTVSSPAPEGACV